MEGRRWTCGVCASDMNRRLFQSNPIFNFNLHISIFNLHISISNLHIPRISTSISPFCVYLYIFRVCSQCACVRVVPVASTFDALATETIITFESESEAGDRVWIRGYRRQSCFVLRPSSCCGLCRVLSKRRVQVGNPRRSFKSGGDACVRKRKRFWLGWG